MSLLWNLVFQKNICIAYILWAVLGTWGVHHLYLGRHNQAFLWCGTIGGFFWIGWIRDVWRIPAYVREANESRGYLEEFRQTTRKFKTPSFSLLRFLAQFFFGMFFGIAVVAGIPMESSAKWVQILVHSSLAPLGIGIAVYLVANIGREKASMMWPLLGAYVVVPVYLFGTTEPGTFLNQSALLSTLLTHWRGKSWRRQKNSKGDSLKQFLLLAIIGVVYVSLWCSVFINNAYVTTQDGQKVKLRDAFGNIRESQAWREPIATLKQLWRQMAYRGWFQTWTEFVSAMDPEGESRAYQVLGLSPGATEQEIRKAYRQLILNYHPDRNKDTSEEFMEIQKAYDTLSTIKGRRARANRQDRDDDVHREL